MSLTDALLSLVALRSPTVRVLDILCIKLLVLSIVTLLVALWLTSGSVVAGVV